MILTVNQTKLPIPSDLLKFHITQLEAELASKTLLGPLESEVSNSKTPSHPSKRPHSGEDEVAITAPKRMKSEVCQYVFLIVIRRSRS